MQQELIYTTVSRGLPTNEDRIRDKLATPLPSTPSRTRRSSSVPWAYRKRVSHYYLQRPRPHTVMGLQERIESRPPVTKDLTGPTPCSYTLQAPRPCPSTVIGPPSKYPRGALPSTNGNREIWTLKVSNDKTPGATSYTIPGVLGMWCPVGRCFPAYSMGIKVKKYGQQDVPAPNKYNLTKTLWKKSPAFTMGCKRSAKSWTYPGPTRYSPHYSVCQRTAPSYSMQGRTSVVTGLR
ncbi:uncharacterized protein [Dysidea avara]|uniref:uncharacterized protein n=1 Tax=Dysidea avara TaxID=196820 RepID=UPI0033320885